jgi:hypothetical protein
VSKTGGESVGLTVVRCVMSARRPCVVPNGSVWDSNITKKRANNKFFLEKIIFLIWFAKK